MAVSSDLVWLLVRNNSSFLVKRDRLQLTKEPQNLIQKNSYKFSGLANRRTVGLDVKDKKVNIILKRTKLDGGGKPTDHHPPKALARTILGKHVRGHKCRGAEAVKSLTAKSHYRGDLSRYAIARYHALHRSLKVDPSKIDKKEKRKRGKHATAAAAKAAAAGSA